MLQNISTPQICSVIILPSDCCTGDPERRGGELLNTAVSTGLVDVPGLVGCCSLCWLRAAIPRPNGAAPPPPTPRAARPRPAGFRGCGDCDGTEAAVNK